MKTFSILAAIAALASLTVAAPAANTEPTSEVAEFVHTTSEKRAVSHVFVTSDSNWGGRSENLQINTGVCLTLSNGWPNIISSFGPDAGITCTGASHSGVRNPGIPDLRGVGFNDRINSFRCT
ncbi:hypothetical protein QBC44DRAFT_253477 [Cladorrhinum sp. PSN332]|nr:hypothetical protein QBC44DRAFT_253477 [Cladorrhinum sp. PSN332]